MGKNSKLLIKDIVIFVFIFITILSLASCRYDNIGTSPSGTPGQATAVSSGVVAPTEVTPSDTASAEAASSPDAKALTVLFIGNSLTFMSKIPEKVNSIALSKNVNIDVRQITHGGYRLSQHLKDFKDHDSFNKSYISEADVIIFQEIGFYQSDTVEVITEFQELFGSDKRFYFLETEFDNFMNDDREQLKNIQFIRTGFVHDQLIENDTIEFKDLHMPNDPHPNYLYGFLAAFTVYCEISNTSCNDFLVEEMSRLIGEKSIPGSTPEIRNDVVQKIQEAVNAALEDE